MNAAILASVQDQAVDYLAADELLANTVPVLAERPNDLDFEIDRAVAELGVAAIVTEPAPGFYTPGGQPASFERVSLLVRVVEDPVLNDTDVTGLEVAERVLARLHRWKPVGLPEALHAAENPVRTVVLGDLVVREVVLISGEAENE